MNLAYLVFYFINFEWREVREAEIEELNPKETFGNGQTSKQNEVQPHSLTRCQITDMEKHDASFWRAATKLPTLDSLSKLQTLLSSARNILSVHFSKWRRVCKRCKYSENLSLYVNVTLYLSKSNVIFDIWSISIFHCIYKTTSSKSKNICLTDMINVFISFSKHDQKIHILCQTPT